MLIKQLVVLRGNGESKRHFCVRCITFVGIVLADAIKKDYTNSIIEMSE